ncbi:DUF3445 domain-containing protein [Spirosoma sp. 209]|uniref:heme-dependent oxidative N-demethylase family protein n=1 Tax=Spirosoma sp. 209 TaxID=1955701 RepID=UPI00098CFA1D|nr:DUF3445 domain-containing protein [Spirosoma sp. 209]
MLPYFPFGPQFNDKIGTRLLTDADPLIDIDDHYLAEVLLKRQLLTGQPGYYYQSQPGHETAQWDIVALVLQEAARRAPDAFTLQQQGDEWHWQNHRLNEAYTFTVGKVDTLPQEPLDWVGRQVAEDLLVLSGEGVRLVAGQLCFGNGWCLDDKLGLPFWDIHAPINPIVESMMRAALVLMERIPLGRPVWRLNWSLKLSDQLDMTSRHTPALDRLLAERLPQLAPDTIAQQLFVRIERQTLTRLQRSGAVLFGIHTYQNRLDRELAERPGAAQNLAAVLETAPPALLDYKGISPFLEPLLTGLKQEKTS